MKRLAALTTALALSAPLAAQADTPKSEPAKPAVENKEQKQADKPAENPRVERTLKLQPVAPRVQAQVLTSTAAPPLQAGGIWGNGKSQAEHYIEQTDKIVKLSDEQKQKIRALFEKREMESKAIQAAIQAKQSALARGLEEASKSKNQEAINKARQAYTDLYAPMSELMKKSNVDLQNVLTAEQREALKQPRFGAIGAGAGATSQPGAPAQAQSVRVNQVPGGGVQIFVSEGGAGGAVVGGTIQVEQQKEMHARMAELAKQAQASHRDILRQRVKRQRELTKQATKLLKQLDELKPEEQAQAQPLLMQIEQTQMQLQQTFGHPGGMLGNVMTGGGMVGPEGGVWTVKTWPDRPGVVEVNGQRMPAHQLNPPPQQATTLRAQQLRFDGACVPMPAPLSPETLKAIDDRIKKATDELNREMDKLRDELLKSKKR